MRRQCVCMWLKLVLPHRILFFACFVPVAMWDREWLLEGFLLFRMGQGVGDGCVRGSFIVLRSLLRKWCFSHFSRTSRLYCWVCTESD